MRTISDAQLQDFLAQAAAHPRGRINHNLHTHDEPVQRMLNALSMDTYLTPHKHENPDKVELLCALIGEVACIQFADGGAVREVHIIAPQGPVRLVDIAPRVYHTIMPLTPSVVLEIIQGPYDAATHKQFAPWCPLEGHADAPAYWAALRAQVAAWGR
jgi:cupin fold WbuC family metalloprotein